jgi:hypothetical protein
MLRSRICPLNSENDPPSTGSIWAGAPENAASRSASSSSSKTTFGGTGSTMSWWMLDGIGNLP